MREYKIKQGGHRAFPLSFGLHWKKTKETREVIFTDSCRYDLGDVDQEDTNKLFGWSYGLHHKNSIRVGWEYDKDVDKIALTLYVYKDNIRYESELVKKLDIGVKYKITLRMLLNHNLEYFPVLSLCQEDIVYGAAVINKITYDLTWGYTLGLYFGGNEKAPHDMRIMMKKIKTKT